MSYKELGIQEVDGLSKHFAKVFLWMALGLAITAIVAFVVYETGWWIDVAISLSGWGSLVLLGIQLVLVLVIGTKLRTMSFGLMLGLFILYSALTGVNFSVLPAVYDFKSMGIAFGCAAVLFVNLGFIGLTTKKDLTKYGPILLAGLITLFVVTLLNIFLGIEGLDRMMNYFAVLLFMGLIAFDMQKIRHYYNMVSINDKALNNLAIYCALELYLDFINMFIRILRIIGRNRD